MTKRRFAIVGAVKGEIRGLDLCKYQEIQLKNYHLKCNFLIGKDRNCQFAYENKSVRMVR